MRWSGTEPGSNQLDVALVTTYRCSSGYNDYSYMAFDKYQCKTSYVVPGLMGF